MGVAYLAGFLLFVAGILGEEFILFDDPDDLLLPMGESLTLSVEKVLQRTFPGYSLTLKLTFDPAWNHERISEEGRDFLNR